MEVAVVSGASQVIDHRGHRFGRLVVIERAPPDKRRSGAWWKCRCDCGAECVRLGSRLRRQEATDCRERFQRCPLDPPCRHPPAAKTHQGASNGQAKTGWVREPKTPQPSDIRTAYSREQYEAMDRKFCAAMRKALGSGAETGGQQIAERSGRLVTFQAPPPWLPRESNS
jgi:hypothetical protein